MTSLDLTPLEASLMIFETACPSPTPQQIAIWCDVFPEYAAEIREHAKYVEPPLARGRAAIALLSERDKVEAEAEGLEIMRAAALRMKLPYFL